MVMVALLTKTAKGFKWQRSGCGSVGAGVAVDSVGGSAFSLCFLLLHKILQQITPVQLLILLLPFAVQIRIP